MAKKFKLKGKHLLGPGVGNEVTLYPMTVADNVTMEKDGTLYSIQEAVNNGAFNGKDGEDGKPGPQGPMGDTSIVTSDGTINVEQTLSNSTGKIPSSHAVHEYVKTHYAQKDGYYEEMAVGLSENLISPDGVIDNSPYIYRTQAGSTSISTGVAEIQSLYGNSIVWNQNAVSTNVPSNRSGLTFTYNSTNKSCVINGIADSSNNASGWWGLAESRMGKRDGHKMYVSVKVLGGELVGSVSFSLTNQNLYSLYPNDKRLDFIDIRTYTGTGNILNISWLQGAEFNNFEFTLEFFDLSQMFGDGNEPTIEQFKQWFPNDYYEYNAGEIVNVNIDGLRTIGFNQLEENIKASKWSNKIKLIGGQQYQLTFDSVSNATNWRIALRLYTLDGVEITGNVFNQYISDYTGLYPYYNLSGYYIEGGNNTLKDRFFTPTQDILMEITFSVGDIKPTSEGINSCLHLTWSGYRNGDYEPYQEHNISIPVKEIKDADNNVLFPNGLLSAGSVKDEITSDKAIKRIGVVELGSLNWVREPTHNNNWRFSAIVSGIKRQPNVDKKGEGIMLGYELGTANEGYSFPNHKDKIFAIEPTADRVSVVDDAYTDAASFKTAMQGKYLYYVLATPIEVDFKETPQTFGDELNLTYFVDDFGTEEFTTDSTTAPVAHQTFYMANLRDKIRNIDGNTDAGALMNPSVDNLLLTLGNALNGTFTKQWDGNNKKWQFTFTPNQTNQLTDALEARQHTESDE